MKQLLTFLLFAVSTFIRAQAPQSIPYQAVVRNTDGSLMASTSMSMIFKIHDVSTTGAVVYEETHSATSNTQGLVSLNVGAGTPITGTFASVNWGSGAKFLQVLMNTGSGNVDLGTQQMMSVPYALYADDVFSRVSLTGDTLFVGSKFYIITGISAMNVFPGCTNVNACNYLVTANFDDGSCLIQGSSCDDGFSNTMEDIISSECICSGILNPQSFFSVGQGAVDIDGNNYETIIIKDQEWFVDNLKTTRFCNGDAILNGSLQDWTLNQIPDWTYWLSNAGFNSVYGKLYNWYAVDDSRGICPCGWEIPSVEDFEKLESNIGPSDRINSYLIKADLYNGNLFTEYNQSGMSIVPGGIRTGNNGFNNFGTNGLYWTSTALLNGKANYYEFTNQNEVNRTSSQGAWTTQSGMSVRCVRTVTSGNDALLEGCTVVNACNYNPQASINDGTCVFRGSSCNDYNSLTYNDEMNEFCVCSGDPIGSSINMGDGVTDIDGNIYKTVIIGEQEWMAENLRVSKFNDGTELNQVKNDDEWNTNIGSGWCFFNNNPNNNTVYGKLYNWYAVDDSRGICPAGWHVPSDSEFNILAKTLDSGADTSCVCYQSQVAFYNTATSDWYNSGLYTNNSGLSIKPAGSRGTDFTILTGPFTGTSLWTSSLVNTDNAWLRSFSSYSAAIYRGNGNKKFGFGVRCIKD